MLTAIPTLDVPTVYRLTAWLENGLFDGAWWTNPAMTADLTERVIETVNVSPISDLYTISSIRVLFPALSRMVWGLGILGAGPDQTGHFDAQGGSGVQYSSRFIFTRPSLQGGLSWTSPIGVAAGVLLSGGFERQRVTVDETDEYGTALVCIGIMSPVLAEMVQAGFAYAAGGHFQPVAFWERDLRWSLKAWVPDSLIAFAAEYTLSLAPASQGWPTPFVRQEDALHVRSSLRLYRPFGLILGFSTDFLDRNYLYRAGTNIHGGLEIVRSPVYPFYGGYEIATSLDGEWHIFHRFWFGYRMGSLGR